MSIATCEADSVVTRGDKFQPAERLDNSRIPAGGPAGQEWDSRELPMDLGLAGQVAVVTGGASGIGAAAVRLL